MLDVIIPVPFSNADLLSECLDRLEQHTDVPFSLTVIVDGGSRDSIEAVERRVNGMADPNWTLLHNSQPVYLNQSIREAFENCSHPLIAMIGPEVWIDDALWFGKMQQIFHRDPTCGVVDTEPNTASSTMAPIRRQRHCLAQRGCRFVLLQGAFARKVLPFGDVDPVLFWSTEAMSGGGTSWSMPGVRYFEAEHKEHELWRAPLADPAISE